MTEFNIIADAHNKPIICNNMIVLDGAAEFIKATPLVIIGDFDKVTKSTLDHFQNLGAKIIKIDDQNSTDLDKGIKYCLEQNATSINIHNAIGGRMDHTLYNTRILKKYYHPEVSIKLFHEDEVMQYFENCTIDVRGDSKSRFSLLSAPSAIINSVGLEYDMQDYKLEYGKSESTCNKLKSSTAKISIVGGALLICEISTKISITT
jgi:thiamine pyrophosphokinase